MSDTTSRPVINSARFVAYSLSDEFEKELRQIVREILDSYDCTDLMAPVYASIKELVINAIKANFKSIYFEGYAPKNRPEEIINYEKALELFKLEISRENSNYFEEFARRDDIKAVVDLWTEEDMLHVQVANPGKMTETEMHNINQKLKDAENCRDLADYCINNVNDPHREGAGLGLILIMMMLKSLRAPRESLLIKNVDNRTTAYLKIPLSKKYRDYLRTI